MPSFFSTHRPELQSFLLAYLHQKKQRYQSDHTWAEDVFNRLETYVVGGKLTRGLLVLLAAESFRPDSFLPSALESAAALELFQSGVLIHDDIIDQDPLRRGQPSIHNQYQSLAQRDNYLSPIKTGENLALCVGDICLFLSFDALSQAQIADGRRQQLQQLFIHELVQVGLAEMEDVRLTVTPQRVSKEEVLKMYAYKTGRYSIYLPLAIGASLVLDEPAFLPTLEKLGESLGTLMQIKDDELGLFGSEAETGKPVTSDVREGKRTLYYLFAMENGTAAQVKKLSELYGKHDLSLDELDMVREIVRESGAYQLVQAESNQLLQQAQQHLKSLPINSAMLEVWAELFAQQTTRRQ